jgi:two-component SAPR family response regulator
VASRIGEAHALLQQFQPHLVFLDIMMPEKNGFEFLNEVKKINFEIIFTTAFNEFAIRAIRFSALDYLLNSDGIILAKKKEIKLRPLDKVRVKEEKLKYQLINIILPIILVIFAGIIRSFWRKRKFEKIN